MSIKNTVTEYLAQEAKEETEKKEKAAAAIEARERNTSHVLHLRNFVVLPAIEAAIAEMREGGLKVAMPDKARIPSPGYVAKPILVEIFPDLPRKKVLQFDFIATSDEWSIDISATPPELTPDSDSWANLGEDEEVAAWVTSSLDSWILPAMKHGM